MTRPGKSIPEILGLIEQSMKKEFDGNRTILSFDEYLGVLAENPERHTRGSAEWTADMMDHYGREEKGGVNRFKLFDLPSAGVTPRVIGQEEVQNHIYRVLRTFARGGINNKLLLLHGPNGSSKSSIAHALMGGMERYSQEAEGATYTFNWIFPIERYTKPGLGINTYSSQGKENLMNY